MLYAIKYLFMTQENYRMGGVYVWPNLSEVLEYRNQVMQVVIDVIDNSSIDIPVTQHSPWVLYIAKYICMHVYLFLYAYT